MWLALTLVLAQVEEPQTDEQKEQLKALNAFAKDVIKQSVGIVDPPPPPPPPSPWSGNATAGLTWVTGNVSALSVVTQAAVQRKTEQTLFAAKLFGAYGEKYGTPHEVLLQSAGAAAQLDWRFNSTFSALAGAGFDADHVKSIEWRAYADLGAGVTWIESKDALVKTDLTARLQPESRFQYYPTPINVDDALLFGPRFALLAHYAFTPTTYVHEEFECVPNLLDVHPVRVLATSTTKVALGVLSIVSATATFTVKYDSAPAPGKRDVDTLFTLGVEAGF